MLDILYRQHRFLTTLKEYWNPYGYTGARMVMSEKTREFVSGKLAT